MSADVGRLAQDLILAGSRAVRRVPGAVGGLGTYFVALDELSAGQEGHDWRRDEEILLARADRSLERRRIASAVRWFDKALRVAYHPTLHMGACSPLVEDPTAFLRPLRASRTGRILLETPIPEGSAPRRPEPRSGEGGDGESAVHLLVIAQQNWTFLRPLLDALRETGRFEILEFEVDGLPEADRPDRERILRARYDLVTEGRRIATPERLVEAYEWADVAFVEWGHHILSWITMLDMAPRRLVARYHRFEAFTPFPLLHDHSVIDRLLHVSPPIRGLVTATAPASASVPTDIVGNLLSRGLGTVSDTPRDTRALVQVGWNREIKDVLFSLDLIERLHREDPGYRLKLVGPELPDLPEEDTPYQSRVRQRLAALPSGAVEQLGVRRDVPEIFAAAGVVLSSSFGEGTHESVMEGLATGCPAVVRDWPHAREYGGASSIYQEQWVVPDVESAAQRIRALQDPVRYAEESAAARDWAVLHRSPASVVDGYDHALRASRC
ncbi:glycosyltransferase [Brachybacterium sp. AOP3-A1-3]|uniref:glycosyltransferase n=1 Tax=Brachybacterium sp. AOP3-A1-3 TaxID=3457699 RepID=UPI004034CAC0